MAKSVFTFAFIKEESAKLKSRSWEILYFKRAETTNK